MSKERQETIADIVADIRSENQGLPEDDYALSPLVCDLLSLADRIEAAHNREIAAKDAEISSLRLKREKEISDAFFCGYDPEEALVAQCSTCRFFRKKHSHCTLNDSLTNAKYKCSKWEFKTNKECADEYKKSINNEVAELREENAHLRAALKPVLECKVMSAMTAEIAPGRSKYCATIIEEAQHIYNE